MNIKEPIISIITPSFNQGKFIADNIKSVIDQDYPNVEHIIVDGGSSDNTIEILKNYDHLKWISEKDRGPVDAIVKGIKMSKGIIIGWLNADDYLEPNILNEIAKLLIEKNKSIVVGNMVCVRPDKTFIYRSNHKNIYNLDYLIRTNSDIITQPSTFFTKEIFLQAGGFDESYKIVWDYELFLRMFKIQAPYFIDKTLAYQRIYDETISRNNARKQAVEMFNVSRKNGGKLTDPIMFRILKRFLFPSIIKEKSGLTVRAIRKLKAWFR